MDDTAKPLSPAAARLRPAAARLLAFLAEDGPAPAAPALDSDPLQRDIARLHAALAELSPLAGPPPPPAGPRRKPYVLAVASHKGGTGRSTAALALAWTWGHAGVKVALVDTDPGRALSLIGLDATGHCPWRDVRLLPELPRTADPLRDRDIVVLDCPPLTEPASSRLLGLADGVVLTCLADPLTLRTLPLATRALRAARQTNGRLRLLGLLVGAYNELEDLQLRLVAELGRGPGGLLLQPAVPYQQEVCDWALRPGSGLPPGLARDAFDMLALALTDRAGLATG